MSVRHTVRKNGNRETVTVNLTPRRAVRLFCLECVGFSPKEVRVCQGDKLIEGGSCPLFDYRLGKARVSIKTILKNCRHCMGQERGQSRDDIKACPSVVCALWPYRMGKDPSRAGKGGSGRPFISQKGASGGQQKAEFSTRGDKCIPRVG